MNKSEALEKQSVQGRTDLFRCKFFEAYASKNLHYRKSNPLLFLKNALNQWLNPSKSYGFDGLQGFALRINRKAVYSVDIMIDMYWMA